MSALVYETGRRLTRCTAFSTVTTVGSSHGLGLVRSRGFGSSDIDGNGSTTATLSTTLSTSVSASLSTSTSASCGGLGGGDISCTASATSISEVGGWRCARSLTTSVLDGSRLSTGGNDSSAETGICSQSDGSNIGYCCGDWYSVDDSCTSNDLCADICDSLGSGFCCLGDGLDNISSSGNDDSCDA